MNADTSSIQICMHITDWIPHLKTLLLHSRKYHKTLVLSLNRKTLQNHIICRTEALKIAQKHMLLGCLNMFLCFSQMFIQWTFIFAPVRKWNGILKMMGNGCFSRNIRNSKKNFRPNGIQMALGNDSIHQEPTVMGNSYTSLTLQIKALTLKSVLTR